MNASDVLRDWVLYNGADRMVGKVDSFKPPALKTMVERFRAGGMDAPMPIDLGMEELKCGWVTSGIDLGTYLGYGIANGLRTKVKVRGAVVDSVSGLPKLVYHTMVGNITVLDPSEWKAGERATLSVEMDLIYYKFEHTVPGAPVIEIDIPNGVRNIGGLDQLLALRLLVGR